MSEGEVTEFFFFLDARDDSKFFLTRQFWVEYEYFLIFVSLNSNHDS